ncbi:NAD-dependent epimerase/dehydratase family protein [Betaproteobacteria bacterium LSUCC0117]|nr:NAD-dependent epimerase/dehydratase family protein [Betaproteobacteria bacterium LSUCC0117]
MILVTGATGFVGRAVVNQLFLDGGANTVVAAVRIGDVAFPQGVRTVTVGEVDRSTDWRRALYDVYEVVHCAGIAHTAVSTKFDHLSAIREVNVLGTLNLARQAAQAGVKRFIFVSSIKVNGECTKVGERFKPDDQPNPADPYSLSKFEAETALRSLSDETGMEIVIVRPPLVYGPGVKANFATMLRFINLNFPMPLGAVKNKRSFVALDNLVDLLILCLHHPSAAGQIFLVSDNEDISIRELLTRLAKKMEKRLFLFSLPSSWLENIAAVFGKQREAQSICGNLQVDIIKTRLLLGWTPKLTLDQGLDRLIGQCPQEQ